MTWSAPCRMATGASPSIARMSRALRERKALAEAEGHPRAHPVWRDEQTALIATTRLVNAARGAGRKVHVLHVTTADEMAYLG